MWQKIRALPLMTYFAVTGFIQDFKNDERGLSGVVVAVLLILVAVLLIALLWGVLSGWLGDLWKDITGAADEMTTEAW